MKKSTISKLNTDLYLFILTPILFVSGFVLFLLMYIPHSLDYEMWMHIHVFSSIVIYYFAVRHIIDHWRWYKQNWQVFIKKSVNLWLLSLSFTLTGLTGLYILIFLEGTSSIVLDIHAVLGVVTTYFVVQHIVKYFGAIRGWIKHKLK